MTSGAADTCSTCGAVLDGAWVCAACGEARPGDPYLGRTLGNRYELRELIGIGGMGRVYRAVHLGLDRMVAVKLINPKHLAKPSAAARFLVEARAASRLNHPNVVAIHDFGGGTPAEGPELYLVMELLAGHSLGEVLREGPMPVARAADVLCQILSALHEAHRNGVIHRDIKPENISIEAVRPGLDRVKVIDFGVAKVEAGTGVTQFGEVVGTPLYMAPEQVSGRPASPTTDLYAVGVLMFEMLTGRRLFEGKISYDIIAQILAPERPDPRVVAPDRGISPALAALCLRAISIDPATRPPSAEAFARSIVESAGAPWSPKHSMLFVTRARPPSGEAPSSSPRPDDGPTQVTRRRSTPAQTPAPVSRPAPSTPDPKSHPTIRVKRAALRPEAITLERPVSDTSADTIAHLASTFQVARRDVLAGVLEAAVEWAPAGRRLGAALLDAGRLDEAYGVLSEILEHTDPRTIEHALIAEQLADIAGRRGRSEEATTLRRKALAVAEALDDTAVSRRIQRLIDARDSGVRAKPRDDTPPSARPIPRDDAPPSARPKTGGGRYSR